jgi:uncharacterized membrane protein
VSSVSKRSEPSAFDQGENFIMNMKCLIGLLALGAIGLSSKTSFAWLQFCNDRTDGQGIWIATGTYTPNISTVSVYEASENECLDNQKLTSAGGTCYFDSWKTQGWWHVTPKNCVTTNGNAINNRYVYYWAELDNGGFYTGSPSAPFWVQNPAFDWDAYVTSVDQGSCAATNGNWDSSCSDAFEETFVELDTGSYSNWTETFY